MVRPSLRRSICNKEKKVDAKLAGIVNFDHYYHCPAKLLPPPTRILPLPTYITTPAHS